MGRTGKILSGVSLRANLEVIQHALLWEQLIVFSCSRAMISKSYKGRGGCLNAVSIPLSSCLHRSDQRLLCGLACLLQPPFSTPYPSVFSVGSSLVL